MDDEDKSDPLSRAFNVEPVVSAPRGEIEFFPPSKDAEERNRQFEEYVDADYSFARENIMSTILKGDDALDVIIEIAKASQAPRAFEVVANLMKTMVDANKDLLELAKRNKELKKVEAETPVTQMTNTGDVTNNLFIGTNDQFDTFLEQHGISGGLRDRVYTKPVNTTKEIKDI